MIRLRKVYYSYPGPGGHTLLALWNINLEILPGSFTSVIGPNNSGKSTLGRIMAGLLSPSEGQVFLEGLEIAQWDPTLLHKVIGLVFPSPDEQIVFPTVEDDLAFGLENLCLHPDQVKKKVIDILRFLEMEECLQFHIQHLSGGQKQKIAIAAMIARGLRYLILDDPTSFLDPESKSEVLALIQRIHQE
ncbi:MAG: ABC transporter ATP-binding protein, partial [bacterium]